MHFWINRTEDMIFQSLYSILPISGSKFCFKQKAVHMASPDSQIPIRLDKHFGSLDLMGSGRSGSDNTSSSKCFVVNR
jgi:hypothetical protein